MEEKGSEVLAYKKAIEGLRKAAEELARYAPMKVNGRCQMHFDGAIHLLKEQGLTVKFSKNYMNYVCSNCGVYINDEIDFMMDKSIQYCPSCGRKVKWDDGQGESGKST